MNPCSSPRSVFSMRAGRGRRCHPRASRSRCIQFLSLWIQLHLLKIEQEGSHTMSLDLLFWYSIGGFSWFNSKRWDCITMEHWQRERKKLTKTRWCPRFYFWTGACFNLSPLNFFLRFYYLTSFFISFSSDQLLTVLDESERLLGEIDSLSKDKQQKVSPG